MSAQPDPVLLAAERLCETLDRIGDALVAVDAESLLETEDTLGRLLSALSTDRTVDDPAALERVVIRAKDALLRCRRLGVSFAGIAGARLRLCTGAATYDSVGAFGGRAVSGSAVQAVT